MNAALASLAGSAALAVAVGAPILAIDMLDGGGQGPADDVPDHTFRWDDVAGADTAPRITLDAGPDGTCSGRIRTHISLDAAESGVKSLVLEPVDGQTCTFDVLAKHHTGTAAEAYRNQTTEAMQGADCCVVTADHGTKWTDGGAQADVARSGWCRLADGWAHTGFPDPPTVVYTRVYHEMDFCYNDTSAQIDAYSGICFANAGSTWATDASECYWSAAAPGPAGRVYLTLHGYFEKQTGNAPPPAHDMWHTVNGDAGTGRVYCSGDIIGSYDGYATTDNCGATEPEPQL